MVGFTTTVLLNLPNCFLNVYVYIHRSMLFSTLVKEVSFCSGQLLQSLITGPNAVNMWQLGTQP